MLLDGFSASSGKVSLEFVMAPREGGQLLEARHGTGFETAAQRLGSCGMAWFREVRRTSLWAVRRLRGIGQGRLGL